MSFNLEGYEYESKDDSAEELENAKDKKISLKKEDSTENRVDMNAFDANSSGEQEKEEDSYGEEQETMGRKEALSFMEIFNRLSRKHKKEIKRVLDEDPDLADDNTSSAEDELKELKVKNAENESQIQRAEDVNQMYEELQQKQESQQESQQNYEEQHYEEFYNWKEETTNFARSYIHTLGAIGSGVFSLFKTGKQLTGEIGKTMDPYLKQGSRFSRHLLARRQDKAINKKFKGAPKVRCGSFQFKVLDQELMLWSYFGPDTILKLPYEVKGRRVTAINPGFLNHSMKDSVAEMISIDERTQISSISSCKSVVKQVKIPKYVRYLPAKLFAGCDNLEVILIPDSVVGVSPYFLSKTYVNNVIILGSCPSNFKAAIEQFYSETGYYPRISCTKEHYLTFEGIQNVAILAK